MCKSDSFFFVAIRSAFRTLSRSRSSTHFALFCIYNRKVSRATKPKSCHRKNEKNPAVNFHSKPAKISHPKNASLGLGILNHHLPMHAFWKNASTSPAVTYIQLQGLAPHTYECTHIQDMQEETGSKPTKPRIDSRDDDLHASCEKLPSDRIHGCVRLLKIYCSIGDNSTTSGRCSDCCENEHTSQSWHVPLDDRQLSRQCKGTIYRSNISTWWAHDVFSRQRFTRAWYDTMISRNSYMGRLLWKLQFELRNLSTWL